MPGNEVEIVVRSKDRTATGFKTAETRASRLVGAMGKVGKASKLIGPPMLVAATAVGAELFRATKGFQDHQKVVKETATRIKEMGATAQITAGHVGSLSDAIEAKTAVDGDQVQSGANMLLTFKNLIPVVGQSSKIFDDATLAATDMAAKFGGDASSQAIVLGKALDNPSKGLSALTRIGVSFSKGEQQQIKDMQDHGDMAGAQALILKAVNKQVSGAAEAQATSWGKLMVKIHGIEDNIGGSNFIHAMANVIHALGNVIHAGGNFIHAMGNVIHAIGNVIHAGGNVVHALGNVVHALGNVGHALGNVGHAFGNMVHAATTAVGKVITFVSGIPGKIVGALGKVGSLLFGAGKAVIQGLIDGIKNMAGTVANAALDVAKGAINAVKGFLHIGSPSKVFEVIGRQVTEGFAGGIGQGHRGVREAAAGMAGAAIGGAAGAAGPGGGQAPGGPVVLEIHSGGSRLDDLLVEVLRKSIRSKGGNVQVVLGT